MGNFGFQKPTKTGLINSGITAFVAAGGYEAYEKAVQKLPITKEVNAGVLGSSVFGAASIKGSKPWAIGVKAFLIGVAINSGITLAEDYGLIKRSGSQLVDTSLKGLASYEDIVNPVLYKGADLEQTYRLSGVGYEADLM